MVFSNPELLCQNLQRQGLGVMLVAIVQDVFQYRAVGFPFFPKFHGGKQLAQKGDQQSPQYSVAVGGVVFGFQKEFFDEKGNIRIQIFLPHDGGGGGHAVKKLLEFAAEVGIKDKNGMNRPSVSDFWVKMDLIGKGEKNISRAQDFPLVVADRFGRSVLQIDQLQMVVQMGGADQPRSLFDQQGAVGSVFVEGWHDFLLETAIYGG